MKLKKVWLMCGTPASGKSSYIASHKAPNSLVVSREAIRKELIKDGEYFSKEEQVFKEFCKVVQKGLNNSETENIYIDATHISRGSRNKILSHLNFPENTELYVIWMNTPEEVCMERNEERKGFEYVPKSAMRRMKIQFEPPTIKEFVKYQFKKVNIIEVKE